MNGAASDRPIAIHFPNRTLLCEWLWTHQWADGAVNLLCDELLAFPEVIAVVGGFTYNVSVRAS